MLPFWTDSLAVHTRLEPLHLFADLSMLERIKPIIAAISSEANGSETTSGHHRSTSPALTVHCSSVRSSVTCAMPEDLMPLGVITLDFRQVKLCHSTGSEVSFDEFVLFFTQPLGQFACRLVVIA